MAEWVALAGLALAIGGVVFRCGQLANTVADLKEERDESIAALRRELALQERSQEHKNAHFDDEIEKLRDWRHHKVGESPGLAAMTKVEDVERRVTRIETKLNGLLK